MYNFCYILFPLPRPTGNPHSAPVRPIPHAKHPLKQSEGTRRIVYLIATLHSEVHPPLRPPDPLPKQPQQQHQKPRRRRNPRLGAQRLHRPVSRHPIDFHIRGHEAAHGPANGDPRAYLAAALRVRVQEIGVERDGRDHDACDLAGEEDGEDDPVVGVLEGEAEDEDGHGHNG